MKMRSILLPGFGRLVLAANNWPRLAMHRMGLLGSSSSTAKLRNGLAVTLRPRMLDWYVFNEAFMRKVYQPALDYVASIQELNTVLDLGANLGYVSLSAALASPRAFIRSFEPGPPHIALIRKHLSENPDCSSRIELNEAAVSGEETDVEWGFDSQNPGGSSLFKHAGETYPVHVRSFQNVVAESPHPISLVKMDIEGSEYDVLKHTPKDCWQKIQSLVIEPHDDPSGKSNPAELVGLIRELGFPLKAIHSNLYFGVRQ